jgi:hypothetical protein
MEGFGMREGKGRGGEMRREESDRAWGDGDLEPGIIGVIA